MNPLLTSIPKRSKHLLTLTATAALLAGCGPARSHNAAGSHLGKTSGAVTGGVCPGASTVAGVDVSSWQGGVSWGAVAGTGMGFAIARISDGSYQDPDFSANWSGIKAAGLIRGAYQFFEPGEDATMQANMVVNAVGTLGNGDLPVTLDVEVTGNQYPSTITAAIHTWMDVVTRGTGKTPIIYTGAYFWDDNVGSADFAGNPLWIAWYGTNCPGEPNAWAGHPWTFHQYSSSGSVAGIAGNVDMDVFNGSAADLQALAGGGMPLEPSNGPIARNVNDELEPIVRGTDGALYHLWQTPGQGNGWSGYYSLGGNVPADAHPVMGRHADGRLEAFVRGGDGNIYHTWQTADYSWSAWASLGGTFTGSPTVINNASGNLEVFARGTDAALYHDSQNSDGSWSGWYSLGGNVPADVVPAVVRNQSGQLEVFVRGGDGQAYHAWQDASTFTFGPWYSLGGNLVGNFAVANNVNNLFELFASTPDGKLWHIWQTGSGGWTDWAPLPIGNSAGEVPSVTRNLDGRLEVFVRGTNGNVIHTWQTTSFDWAGPQDMGGPFQGDPKSIANADGQIEVFAVGQAGDLMHIWQTSPGGGWSPWDSLGGIVTGL